MFPWQCLATKFPNQTNRPRVVLFLRSPLCCNYLFPIRLVLFRVLSLSPKDWRIKSHTWFYLKKILPAILKEISIATPSHRVGVVVSCWCCFILTAYTWFDVLKPWASWIETVFESRHKKSLIFKGETYLWIFATLYQRILSKFYNKGVHAQRRTSTKYLVFKNQTKWQIQSADPTAYNIWQTR